MKRTKLNLKGLALALVLLPVLSLSQGAYAAIGDEGQIEGGDIYRPSNVTDGTGFVDPTSADACEVLRYRIRIHNPGPSFLSNVNVKVDLPSDVSTSNTSTAIISSTNADPESTSDKAVVNLSSAQSIAYTPGTTQLLDSNRNFVRALPDGLTQGGINIGDQGVSINNIRYVQFDAKVGCPQVINPVYSCDAFAITASKDRKVKIATFTTTAKDGAAFKDATVNWGDSTAVLRDANIVDKEHQYAKDGTYTITATAYFTVNGAEVSAGGPNCVQQVTFKEDQPPKVTPPTTPAAPTKLVNTGAGETLGLFAIVTAAGAFLYRRMLTRSFDQ
jgi:hypothetical protein